MAAAQNMAMTTTQKIIAIAVTIIIISTVAIPVINDIDKTYEKVYNNEDYYYSNLINDNATHTIVYASATFTIDGIELTSLGLSGLPVLIADSMLIIGQSTDYTKINVQYLTSESTYTSVGHINGATIVINGTTKTISVSDVTTDNESVVSDFSAGFSKFCYVVGDSGDYVSILPSSTASKLYVADSSKILSVYATWSSEFAWVFGDDSFSTSGNEISLVADLSSISGYAGVYEFDLSNSTSTSDVYMKVGSTNTASGIVIIPSSVTAVSESAESVVNLIHIIPILLILVPVMLAVRMITLRRN